MINIKKICAVMLIIVLTSSLIGCSAAEKLERDNIERMCPENDIISYEPVDTSKQIITIGNYMNVNSQALEDAIEEKFPGVEVVTTISNCSGYIELLGKNQCMTDIILYSFIPDLTEYLYDLSSQSFTNRYNLTSLDALSVDSKIYQLPVASSVAGIFYNKTLFEEHNWKVPQTRDEFYQLCETISSDGIRPFAPCLKYAATVADVGLGFSNREIFGTMATTSQFYSFAEGNESGEGVIEPLILALRELYERGIIVESDFSASATQYRQAMYDGEIAMIPYGLNLVSFYDVEQPDCEIGFMGFPTDEPGEYYLPVSHDGACIGLSRHSMENEEKSEILLDILEFLSTDEGQDVLFKCFTGISSSKSYQTNVTTRFDEVKDCINSGRVYFPQAFWQNEDSEVIEEIITGDLSMAEMIETMDAMADKSLGTAVEPEVYGTATEDFSMLETSMFMADAFCETTGADIGLVLAGSSFKGVMLRQFKGDITVPEVFNLRGMSGENCLTVYEITGKNLKELMEHPYVNGQEENVVYAPSGLKLTYAPWKDQNSNVISLTLADGSQIDDAAVYTVAAWDTSIDEKYIEGVAERYEEQNNAVEYMKQYIKEKAVISPPKDGRITLDWTQE